MELRFTYYAQLFFMLLLGGFVSCDNAGKNGKEGLDSLNGSSDLIELLAREKLVAITDYNSTNYFVYRGEPMGFQFELLTLYAEHLGVKLELIISNDLEEKFDRLLDQDCDLIAINMTVTRERSKKVRFTEPHTLSRQVLIQQKPQGWRNMPKSKVEELLIRNQLDLAEKEVYIQKNSSFSVRMHNLMDEIGDTIYLIEDTDFGAEQLVSMVAKGEIKYTVCDENVALVNKTYYPNIDVETPISFPQKLAWAVRPDSDSLLADINRWLKDFKKTKQFQNINNKYFKNSKSVTIVNSEYYSMNEGKISVYDDLIRKYSKKIGWDWRLLASLIYQESHFDPCAMSWAGAFGLMQLMPSTAERFGADSLSTSEEQIAAGVKYILWLDEQFLTRVDSREERIKFILASYNVGLGHILDARNLADKYDMDSNIWEGNVDFYILNKSNPDYYRDPIVKYGYCRGEEPYNYVNEILERFEHYKNVIPE